MLTTLLTQSGSQPASTTTANNTVSYGDVYTQQPSTASASSPVGDIEMSRELQTASWYNQQGQHSQRSSLQASTSPLYTSSKPFAEDGDLIPNPSSV